MRKSLMTLCGAAALLLAPHTARADIDWSYRGDSEVKISSGGSTLSFIGAAGGAGNSTGVVLYNISASSTTPNSGTPDHFDATPFTLTVTIIDDLALAKKAGNHEKSIQFEGYFTGDMTKGSLNNWSVSWLEDEGSVVLGDTSVGMRQYDVKIDGFLPPSPNSPTANGFGVIHANVIAMSLVNPDLPPPPPTDPPVVEPSETPEPTSLLLAGLGLCGIGAARWRRRGTQRS